MVRTEQRTVAETAVEGAPGDAGSEHNRLCYSLISGDERANSEKILR